MGQIEMTKWIKRQLTTRYPSILLQSTISFPSTSLFINISMRATIVCAIACAMLALQAEAALTTGRVNLGFFDLGRDLHASLPFYRYNPR
jgi:hypothetical protein